MGVRNSLLANYAEFWKVLLAGSAVFRQVLMGGGQASSCRRERFMMRYPAVVFSRMPSRTKAART